MFPLLLFFSLFFLYPQQAREDDLAVSPTRHCAKAVILPKSIGRCQLQFSSVRKRVWSLSGAIAEWKLEQTHRCLQLSPWSNRRNWNSARLRDVGGIRARQTSLLTRKKETKESSWMHVLSLSKHWATCSPLATCSWAAKPYACELCTNMVSLLHCGNQHTHTHTHARTHARSHPPPPPPPHTHTHRVNLSEKTESARSDLNWVACTHPIFSLSDTPDWLHFYPRCILAGRRGETEEEEGGLTEKAVRL